MSTQPTEDLATRVAIIGMSGRFPGARDVDQFWANLCDGVESITRFSDAELLAAGVTADELADPSYVKAAPVLDDIERFDAEFFGFTPREAQLLDPQQRLFLENAWAALESAGLDPAAYDGSVGVFAGSALSTYLLHNLAPSTEVRQTASRMQVVLGNDKDSIATRVAYAFDLRGPCYTIQSYCSTSLVAVAAACSSLVAGECDVALAGGAAVSVPHRVGYRYQEGGIASPDGSCRAFDERAQGAPLGNGVGVVVLKRLSDALADGDPVTAVIRGWAVNNDGALKVGYTAPGVRGQSAVITEALENADVDPSTIGYVEAHGTGTALGDAAEFSALSTAFASVTEPGRCVLGSVKTNVGHLDRAAGVAGLIKTALALRHRTLPPTLHFRRANPQIDLANSPFRVLTDRTPWPDGGHPRRAGVSAFGIGGTNAHVVLEEAPPPVAAPAAPGRPHLLVLSARTAAAADARAADLAGHLDAGAAADLADVAHTLRAGRRPFEHRRALVVQDPADAVAVLRDPASARLLRGADPRPGRPVGLMFAGVGENYPGIAAGLYRTEPEFRRVVDECCDLLTPVLGRDLRPLLVDAGREPGAGGGLRALLGRGGPAGPETGDLASTELAQPAMFVAAYALARLLESWGIRPDTTTGYSVGEYVAATLAGVLSWPDALRLVAYRAALIGELPPGAMVAVPLSEADLAPLLGPDLDIAAVNAPSMCVVAGPTAGIAAFEHRLGDRGVVFRRLDTTHPFHSRALAPLAGPLTDWVRANVTLSAPRQRYVSTLTGAPITDDEATDPAHWARHMCAPVRFADAAAHLLAEPDRVLVEIGPGQTLGGFVRQHPDCPSSRMSLIVPVLPAAQDPADPVTTLHTAVARLWLSGVTVDWSAYAGGDRRRVPLPTYPFQRSRYWIDAPGAPAPDPAAGHELRVPRWVRADAPAGDGLTGPFLVLSGDHPLGGAVRDRLAALGPCVTVTAGDGYAEAGDDAYVVRPDSADDHARLIRRLAGLDRLPRAVVHLWGVTGDVAGPTAPEVVAGQRRLGFDSLARLAPALAERAGHEVPVLVVTDHAYDVDGTGRPAPGKAAAAGACLVIPQEYPALRCRRLDVDGATPPGAVVRELGLPGSGDLVAIRDGARFVREYAPAPGPGTAPVLRDDGVYLLTGGLGGIGLRLAEHIARRVARPRLVLTGRTGLPPRDTWASPAADPATAERIRRVRAIEDLGAEVLVLAADGADPDSVAAAVHATADRFGALHGVVHGAGVTAPEYFAPLATLTDESVAAHFTAKVDSLLALDRALDGRDLDFCVLQSSMSAVLGGIGFAAYAAANAVLDAFAATHARWTSVNWDTWRPDGDAPAQAGIGASMNRYAMTAPQGLAAFDRVLATPAAQLVVSAGDLDGRLGQWVSGRAGDTPVPPRPAAALFPRPDLAELYVPPRDGVEQRLAVLWQETLGLQRVGVNDNFFDLGGTSLIGLQLLRRLGDEYQRDLPAVTLFEAPTVAALARHLGAGTAEPAPDPGGRRERARAGGGDIAVIGMAGRFPGANDVDAFWRNLRDGVESIRFFTEDELAAAGVPVETARRENYVPARPVLDGPDEFDAAFFGYSPREAQLTDPQHRVFLECAWTALERAGYAPRSVPGPVGVFAGANISTYLRALYEAGALDDQVSDYQAVIGNDKDALTTTVSYKLDLTGPSMAVQTFCSTSLVATHLAVRSLRDGECDMALAGGVSIRVPDRVGHLWTEGGMESPDGHVRAFDARSRGSMFGDGAGVVLLKRLDDALADGDHVIAVIKGSALNNDGSLKVGFTAPSVTGQTEVVRRALADAGVPPETVSYVEAHGTGTALGDPIEVASLTRAFGDAPARGSCLIGSVKTNVGHLDRAAGVSGLIKAALALEHRQIPATLHFTEPNPQIDFAGSPFRVNDRLRDWQPADGVPRRAGVNSLGMGGTNAHLVLEEAPPRPAAPPARDVQLLVLSARDDAALGQATANLARHLREHPGAELADVAYTLLVGREVFAHRRAVVCTSADEAVTALSGDAPERVLDARQDHLGRPVGLLFGDEPAALTALYDTEPAFRDAVDEWGPAPGYAVARVFLGWGLRPDAVAGIGTGALVAAAVVGVLTPGDAQRLLARADETTDPAALTDWIRQNVTLSAPSCTVAGLTADQATDPGHWAGLLCAPAAAADGAAEALLADPDRVVLTIGAGPAGGDRVVDATDGHTAVARLWLAGVTLDWAAYTGGNRRRVPLPTYPFQRSRYWIDPPAATAPAPAAITADADPRHVLESLPRLPVDSWYWMPAWRQTVAPAVPAVAPDDVWLVLADRAGVADAMRRELTGAGARVVLVRAADLPGRDADGGHRIRPGNAEDVTALLAEVRAEHGEPRYVAHLWGLDDTPADGVLRRGYLTLLWLLRALGTAAATGHCDVVVATCGAHDVTGTDPVRPDAALVAGPCRVAPLEHDRLRCRQVDVTPGDAAPLARRLLTEFADDGDRPVVAWRGDRRWERSFERLPAPAAEPPLRRHGVYLVTGGLGGVGLAIADGLARQVQARLVLVSRHALPPREQWPELTSDPRTPADLLRRIRAVTALEDLGAEVLPCAADVGDPRALREVVRETIGRFGALHGVVHAAGVPGMGLIQFRDDDNATAALAPKVAGTAALRDSLADVQLDFLALFSSITSVTGGGPGQVDYCSANAYLDAVAQAARGDATPVVSIDWGEWQWNAWSAGLSGYTPEVRRYFEENRRRFGISAREGWQAFLGALSAGQPQVVVSTQDFAALAAVSGRFTVGTVLTLGRDASGRHPRPELGTPYAAPETDVQRTVAALWAEALGLTEVGLDDNFFELGGNSLLGVDLVARLCRALDAPALAPHVLYVAPTVRALADAVTGAGTTEWVDDRRERGERRRQQLRTRRVA